MVLILGGVIFGIIVKLKQEKAIHQSEILSLNNSNANLNGVLSEAILTQYYNWKLTSDSLKNVLVEDLESNEVFLMNLIDDKSILFFFEGTMCMDCLNKEFENLESLASVVGKDRILILAEGYKPEVLKRDSKFERWSNQIYVLRGELFNFSHNLSHTPSIVFLDDDKRIKLAYHAMKNANLNFELLIDFINENKTPL
tara:strand:- start:501 stop:1094 length:594 start_codon:yes stop_codon:yes gene_type:complete